MLKNIESSGLQIGDYRTRRAAQVAACFAEIFSLYEQGKVKPAIPFGLAALLMFRFVRVALGKPEAVSAHGGWRGVH